MQDPTSRLQQLHWDDVKLLLALYRQGSVGKAAAALGVDGSTVSRRLATLEDVLSSSLFVRGRDGVTPTEAAEQLLPIAEELEQTMARFTHQARQLERAATGVVRLASPPDVAEVVLAPLLPELVARHPGLTFTLDANESVLDLTRREADLALRTVRPESGDLVLRRLAQARWVLVAAPRLAQRLGVLRAFERAPWIGWGERFAGLPAARWLAQHGRGVVPLLRSDSLAVQLAAVRAGVGVALVPEPTARHYRLRPVRLARSLAAACAAWPVSDLFLVTHRALRDVPRVKVVWDLLVERWGER